MLTMRCFCGAPVSLYHNILHTDVWSYCIDSHKLFTNFDTIFICTYCFLGYIHSSTCAWRSRVCFKPINKLNTSHVLSFLMCINSDFNSFWTTAVFVLCNHYWFIHSFIHLFNGNNFINSPTPQPHILSKICVLSGQKRYCVFNLL